MTPQEQLNIAISETASRAFEAGLQSLQMMVEIAGVQYHIEFTMEIASEYLSQVSATKPDSIGE